MQSTLVLDSSVFILKMGGGESADEIIEIVDPGRYFSDEESFAILKEKSLLRPTYQHAIRFAEQHGTAPIFKKKPFVIFLHEDWRSLHRHSHYMMVDGHARCTEGDLHLTPGCMFSSNCVLAGVRPRK